MGKTALLMVAAILGACDDSGAGTGANFADVLEFDFSTPLGTQRATAWTLQSTDAAGLSNDDHIFAAVSQYVLKRTHTAADPPLWSQTIPGAQDVPMAVHGTSDGGVVVLSDPSTATLVTRLAADGTVLWQHPIADRGNGHPSVTQTTSGDIAVAQGLAGSLDASYVYLLDGATGDELHRTEIPWIHVDSANQLGTAPDIQGKIKPGDGIPELAAVAPAADGGVFVAGFYFFSRSIQCGTESEPKKPTTSSCANAALDGLLARVDSAGQLSWARRLGGEYQTGYVQFKKLIPLSDGAVLAVGGHDAELYWVQPLHAQGIVARYAANGDLQFAKSFPWGKAPGASYYAGTRFDAGAAAENGAADVVLLPPQGIDCRLVRFEASGQISRVQILTAPNAATDVIGPNCTPLTLGAEIAWFQHGSPTKPLDPAVLTKLAP